jgi:hypothetical protein
MRPEVQEWVKGIVTVYQPKAPVLEVGSYFVNGTIRDLFPEKGYIGIDLQRGPGVDVVTDICKSESHEEYATVVCCETLEHIIEPWTAIERMYTALKPGGVLILTTHFAFPIHDYPGDYFRFTPDGLRYLLERAGFTEIRIDIEGPGPRGVFAVGTKSPAKAET